MTRGQQSDPEWKATMPTFIWYFSHPAVILGLLYLLYKPFMWDAPVHDLSDAPPAYGFHVRGSTSIYSDAVRARSDGDVNSSTFGLWTPPPEWRDFCIETAGMPLSACSYFQHEEYPVFMTFYWIALYMMYFFETAFRFAFFYVHWIGPRSCPRAILATKDDLGDILTPWGLEKNPNCRQMYIWYIWYSIFSLLYATQWADAYQTVFGDGIGLIHSMRSGKLYLGAQWNEFPIYEPVNDSEYYGEIYFRTHIYYPFWWVNFAPGKIFSYWGAYGEEFAMVMRGHLALYIQGIGPWIGDLFGVCGDALPAWIFINYVLGISLKKNEKFGKETQDRLWPRVLHWSFEGVWVAISNMTVMHPIYMVSCIMLMLILLYNTGLFILTSDAYANDEMHRLMGFVNHGPMALNTLFAVIAWTVIFSRFIVLGLRNQFAKSKSLLSDAMYKARKAKLDKTVFGFLTMNAFFVLMHSPLLMPQGMAMQQFGTYALASWPSPMNFIFGVPGSAANMLATPLHRLICRAGFLYLWTRYLSAWLWESHLKPQPCCGQQEKV